MVHKQYVFVNDGFEAYNRILFIRYASPPEHEFNSIKPNIRFAGEDSVAF